MTKYPIDIDDELWDLFKGTIPSGQKINIVFREFVEERVGTVWTEDAIDRNPQFDERHLRYFTENIHTEDKD